MLNLHGNSKLELGELKVPTIHQIESGALARVGNTPLVQIRGLDTGCCDLFLKLENQNPGGSIKDRVGIAMIRDGERRGILNQESHIVEATSGNTGIGLAFAAGLLGYRLTLVIPDRVSPGKIAHCRALGAEIVITRSDVQRGHPEYFQNLAESLAQTIPHGVHLNQFANPANIAAHEKGTAPEIYTEMKGEVDAIVCGVGSGGTLTGMSRFFSRVSPKTEMILADPVGSIVGQVYRGGDSPVFSRYKVEGVGSDFIPPLLDLSSVRGLFQIPDQESFSVCRELLRSEGILAGTSSGVLIAAALRYCRAQSEPKRVVTFVCDTGDKYWGKIYGEGKIG